LPEIFQAEGRGDIVAVAALRKAFAASVALAIACSTDRDRFVRMNDEVPQSHDAPLRNIYPHERVKYAWSCSSEALLREHVRIDLKLHARNFRGGERR